MSVRIGGANHIDIFVVTDSGSAYTVLETAGNTLTLNNIKSSEINIFEGSLSLDQILDNKALNDFIQAHQSNQEVEEPVSEVYEDGTREETVADDNTTKVVAIIYGKNVAGLVKVAAIYGVITNSGNYRQEHNNYTRPSFEISGIATVRELELDGVLATTKVAALAELSIASGKKTVVDFLAVAV